MKHHLLHALFILIIILGLASGALAAGVTITPQGNGVFSINGYKMDGVAGFELYVNYDSSALASPTAQKGTFIVTDNFLSNPNFAPNTLKIAYINSVGFSGGGQLAVVSFASHTGTGSITVSSNMIDTKGVAVPTSSRATAMDFQTSSTVGTINWSGTTPTMTSGTTNTGNTGNQGSLIQTSLGTVSMPGDSQPGSDTKAAPPKPADSTVAAAKPAEPAIVKTPEPPAVEKPAAEPQKPEKIRFISYPSIVDDFRTYNGPKTPPRLLELLNKQVAPVIRQEPTVVLSDSKNILRIIVEINGAADKSPNFALSGAKLVSLNRDAAAWIVEAMPQAGALQANLTILTDSDTIEYPLTLAPVVAGISASEADFAVFLKDPKRDLNGDGKHDYTDDYIYAVNYLVKKGVANKSKE